MLSPISSLSTGKIMSMGAGATQKSVTAFISQSEWTAWVKARKKHRMPGPVTVAAPRRKSKAKRSGPVLGVDERREAQRNEGESHRHANL